MLIFKHLGIVLPTGEHQDVVVVDLLLAVGEAEELLVDFVEFLAFNLYSENRETVFEGCSTAAGCKYD